MNKNLFLGMFAATGMLFATSCSNDELDVVQSGNEAQVTFSLAAEGGIATRAISDGKGAKKLVYAVYDAKGELIRTIANADGNGQIVDNDAFDNGSETVTITLAKGQQYTVAFWAQNPNCTAYTTTDLKNVTVDYEGLNNDETRDAFFKAETFTVTGNEEIDVVLKRPFAQINVGVTEADWNAAVASGIEIEKSKVTIEKAATSINLLTGKVEGEQTVEYGFDIIPEKFTTPETLEVDVDRNGTIDKDEKYKYLSMSYILANDATTGYAKTTLEDLDFTFAPKSGNEINFSEGLNTVPVQRNWRTNIIGQILTGKVNFNITIDPIYDGEYNNGDAYGVKANNTYYKTIKDAIDAGATEIELTAGLWKMPSVSNKTLKISGANKDAKIDLSDIVALHNTSVDFTNVTIVKENENHVGFQHANVLNYTDCVFENEYWGYGTETFNNCVFNQTSAGNYNVWTYGANATFNDCTFNSAGKAVLVYQEGGPWRSVVFKNCTFNASAPVEGKSAIEIDSSLAPFEVTIENCTATGFAKGSVSGNILYNLKKGVQGTKGEGGVNCQITLNGDNTYAEGLIVKDGNYFASSNKGITNAISDGAKTINLKEGNYVIPSSAKGKTLKFIGTGTPEDVKVAVTKVGSGENCDYGLDGSTVTFEGITITTNSSTYIGYARCKGTYKNCVINGTYTLYGDSKFERCTFNVSGDVYNIWTWGAKKIEFDRCKFNSDGKALLLYQEETNTVNLTVNSCIFNDNGGLTSKKAAIEIGDAPNGATPTYNVTVSGTIVNGYEINNEGINTGTTLWGNKNSMPNDRLNVTVDGVNVY